MVSKVLLALCVVVAVAAAVPAGATGGGYPWIPPWLPLWTPCKAIGTTCVDCTTKQICTILGGFQITCINPALPHCNNGACSATPSAECAPATNPPATDPPATNPPDV